MGEFENVARKLIRTWKEMRIDFDLPGGLTHSRQERLEKGLDVGPALDLAKEDKERGCKSLLSKQDGVIVASRDVVCEMKLEEPLFDAIVHKDVETVKRKVRELRRVRCKTSAEH